MTDRWIGLLGVSMLVACAEATVPAPTPSEADFEAVSPRVGLPEGYPDPATQPQPRDHTSFPHLHDALVAEQSTVKSQGRRGVCSIFSSVAHMEHMYGEAGMPEPDFSEQFLQWSVKFEVNSFPNSGGSNSYYNLRALYLHGIPTEDVWPYEIDPWGPTEDPACDEAVNDPMPTRCFTNGAPTEEMLEARRYELPRGRWVSVYGEAIKREIALRGRGVIVGLPVFYQSWNHRLSPLAIDEDYKALGYVLFPTDEDVEESEQPELRAGHSIYIVGWDDDLEIQKRDAEGNPVTDADGNPVTEKGFYIFKNSWGTSSWGRDNPHGAGFGYLSYEYVRQYGDGYTSAIPAWTP